MAISLSDLLSTESLNTLNNASKSYSFLGNLGNYATKAFDFMDTYSKPIGTLGGLYGAYNSYDMANKQYDLMKDAYNYNKYLSNLQVKRQQQADTNLATGFANSTYNQ